MSIDVFNAFQNATKYLPSALFRKKERERLEAFSSQVEPPFLTTFYGFETTLIPTKRWVDLAFYSPISNEQLTVLEKYWENRKTSSCAKCIPWEENLRLLLREQKDDPMLKEYIDAMWFCFDLGSSPVWPPVSNLYLSSVKNEQLEKIVERLFFLFKREKISTRRLATITEFVQLCQHFEIKIAFLGFMFARNSSNNIRFYLTGERFQDPENIREFLEKVKHPGMNQLLMPFLKKLPNYIGKICLMLDLDEVMSPKFGLECHLRYLPNESPMIKWADFLHFLQNQGMTNDEKRRAVLSWIGGHKKRESELLSDPFSSSYHYFFRTLHHIKVINHPGKLLEAKAYLATTYEKRD